VGNQGDVRPTHFAPGTRVAIPQFNELNRPVEFGAPFSCSDAIRVAIDLYERPGTQKRIQRVVLYTDVSVLAMTDAEFLNQRDGNLSPNLDHPRKQARFFETEAFIEADREHDRLFRVGRFDRS
jgi:hypothetical protein